MAGYPATYTYTRLEPDAIRLLMLTSLPYSPVIQGRLVAFGEGELPKYTAISYTWGYGDLVNRIHVTDTEYVPITHSAAYIALRVRGKRWYWVDSICINQQDNEEKARQVAMMWRIYSEARLVEIWLGELTGDVDLALAFLRQWNTSDLEALANDDDLVFSDPRVEAI